MDSLRAKEGERRVAADQWDIDGWNLMASEAERAVFLSVQPTYERLVTQFPSNGKFWRMYAEHMARERVDSDEDVILLYNRAVTDSPTSIELWHSYSTYMTSRAARNPGSPSHEAQAVAVLERALSDAGLDFKADVLWSQYLTFLMNQATMSDSQRRESLRRLYQRAVRNPMDQLDVFWRRYTEFENDPANNSGNKESVRAAITELQAKYHEARTECRVRTNRRQGITLHTIATPPRARTKEITQSQSWRRFIAWERSNPHNLSLHEMHARVVHAYESALGPLYRYAAFWIEYMDYLYECLCTRAAREGLNAGGTGAGGAGGVKSGTKDVSCKAVGKDCAATAAAMKKMGSGQLEAALERSLRALPDNVTLHAYANSLYVRIGKGEKGVTVLETLAHKFGFPLAYVHLMRASWKQDGRDAARKTFSRARKDERAAHPLLYVAAATMEFVLSKDSKIPRNVFEFGLKNFPHNALLTLKFVDWLWGMGDTEYARVVLRKVLPEAQGTEEEVKQLWERWLELEEVIGDAASVDQVLSMWKESGTGRPDGILQDVVRMSRFEGMEGMSAEELAVMGHRKDEGGETGMNGGSSGSGGCGNVGGKRDPRTGRRVDKTGTGYLNKGKDGNGVNGTSSRGNKKGGGGDGDGDVLKVARRWLDKLASSFPPFTAPMPEEDINTVLRTIMDTPDAFSDTPAGRTNATLPPVTGKKRKHEDGKLLIGQDVFRTRQAAKQSRLR